MSVATQLCVSLAARPGRFGETVFTAGFRHLELPFVYVARGVATPERLRQAIVGLRGLDVRGCGVSMPWKTIAMAELDAIDAGALSIGAINTIVNDGGVLTGFNTDASGARRLFAQRGFGSSTRAVVAGAGGAARAVTWALRALGAEVTILGRDRARARGLADAFAARSVAWGDPTEGDLFVNCTPVGMTPDDGASPLDATGIERFRTIADMVASPPRTALIAAATERSREVLTGLDFALAQAADQFRLYTGREAPIDVMRAAAAGLARA